MFIFYIMDKIIDGPVSINLSECIPVILEQKQFNEQIMYYFRNPKEVERLTAYDLVQCVAGRHQGTKKLFRSFRMHVKRMKLHNDMRIRKLS